MIDLLGSCTKQQKESKRSLLEYPEEKTAAPVITSPGHDSSKVGHTTAKGMRSGQMLQLSSD